MIPLQQGSTSEIVEINIISDAFKKGVKYYFGGNPRLQGKTVKGLNAPSYSKRGSNSAPNLLSVQRPNLFSSIFKIGTGLVWDIRNGLNGNNEFRQECYDVSVYITLVDNNQNFICYQTPYKFFYESDNIGYQNFNPSNYNKSLVEGSLGFGTQKRKFLKKFNFENINWNKSYIEFFENTFNAPPYYGSFSHSGKWCFVLNAWI